MSFVATWPLAAGPPFRGETASRPAVAADDSELAIAIADIEALSLEPGRRLSTRQAGLFLFLPLLARLGFDQLSSRLVIRARQWFPQPTL